MSPTPGVSGWTTPSATSPGPAGDDISRSPAGSWRDSGLAVSLDDGSALLTVADGTSTWQPVPAARACELAGIPAPEVDGEAETARRLDPFHVERQTSAVFNAIVGLAVERGLPCAHALRAWRAGVWDGTFDGSYLEQPETFAASVLERMARASETATAAVLGQLAGDIATANSGASHRAVVKDTGWWAALGELPDRVTRLTSALAAAKQSRRDAARADDAQLSLI